MSMSMNMNQICISIRTSMNKYNGKMGFYLECNRGCLVHTLLRMNMISYTYDDCELSLSSQNSMNVAQCIVTLAHTSSS